MLRKLNFAGAVLAAVIFSPAPSTQAQESNPAGGIVLRAAEGTQLGEILTRRRVTLEERRGGPLTGHQWWLWGLGAFDYDRDGDEDLLVCIHGSTNGMILRNELKETSKLTFVDATEELGVDGLVPSTDNYPLAWDFDGDGYLDIAGLLDDSKTPCLLNRGGKQFEKAPFSLHPINYPDEIRDLNGDGYVDIAQTTRDKRIEFLYDAESGSFTRSEAPAPPAGLPPSLRAELQALREKEGNRFIKFSYFDRDLNGDRRLDRVVRAFASYSGDRLGWYLPSGDDGGFADQTLSLGLPRGGAPVLIEDVDHDGDIDVLIASGEEAGLYLNDGKGSFSLRTGPLTDFVKQRCPYLHEVMRADLDGDGDLELAVSNRRYGRAMVFENLGDGEFAPVLNVRGWDADPLVLRDINDDGLVDVLVGGAEGRESIGVFLNATPRPGNITRLYPRLDGPNVYAVGTRVEAFPAGGLDQPNARPILVDEARPDGSPIHLGLGDADTFDLRVTFPGRPAIELKNVAAASRLFITPQGAAPSDPLRRDP